MAIDFGEQQIGTTQRYTLTLVDGSGAAVNLSGVTAYSAVLAPGAGRPSVATLSAVTLSAAAGTVTVTVDNSATTTPGVFAGQWQVFVTATDASGEPLNASRSATLTLTDGPGTAASPSTTLTRATAEAELVVRKGGWLKAAGQSRAAVGGNPFLGSCLMEWFRWSGVATVDRTRVSDADLALVADADTAALLDLAEYRLMVSCIGNFIMVTDSRDTRKHALSDLRKDWIVERDAMLRDLKSRYGYGLGTIRAATLSLNNDASCEDDL